MWQWWLKQRTLDQRVWDLDPDSCSDFLTPLLSLMVVPESVHFFSDEMFACNENPVVAAEEKTLAKTGNFTTVRGKLGWVA